MSGSTKYIYKYIYNILLSVYNIQKLKLRQWIMNIGLGCIVWTFLYHLPDSSRLNRLWVEWLMSFCILWALHRHSQQMITSEVSGVFSHPHMHKSCQFLMFPVKMLIQQPRWPHEKMNDWMKISYEYCCCYASFGNVDMFVDPHRL